MRKVRLDLPVQCSYSRCGAELVEGQVVRRTRDGHYLCSTKPCIVMYAVENLRVITAERVTLVTKATKRPLLVRVFSGLARALSA